MNCRPGCAACCIIPSITSPLPGMPEGKPAGIPCVHLNHQLECELFGQEKRPDFCLGLRPDREMCGTSPQEARDILRDLERRTRP